MAALGPLLLICDCWTRLKPEALAAWRDCRRRMIALFSGQSLKCMRIRVNCANSSLRRKEGVLTFPCSYTYSLVHGLVSIMSQISSEQRCRASFVMRSHRMMVDKIRHESRPTGPARDIYTIRIPQPLIIASRNLCAYRCCSTAQS